MLCAHYVDLYWLVMPEIPHDIGEFTTYSQIAEKYAGTATHFFNPVNFLLAIGALGLVAGGTLNALSRVAVVPVRDPRLGESLAFENM